MEGDKKVRWGEEKEKGKSGREEGEEEDNEEWREGRRSRKRGTRRKEKGGGRERERKKKIIIRCRLIARINKNCVALIAVINNHRNFRDHYHDFRNKTIMR